MRRAWVWRRAAATVLVLAASLAAGCGGDPPAFVIDLDEHRFIADDDDPQFASRDFDDSGWRAATLPMTWRVRTARSEVYGWHRFRFRVPDPVPSGPLAVELGEIAWSDEVFLNGRRIGGTGEMDGLPRLGTRPRLYAVPDGALHPGDNVLAIRIRGIPFGVNGLLAQRVGIGDALELERAHARAMTRTQTTEALLLGFLLFSWLLVVFFPKRQGRATLFLLATITMALVMLWLLGAMFRNNAWSPEVGANITFGVVAMSASWYWGFVGMITRGRLPLPVKAVFFPEMAVAVLHFFWPAAVAVLNTIGVVIGTGALVVLGWLLIGAVRDRTPGAIPIAFSCAIPAATVLGMIFLPSPFALGLPLVYYGLVAAVAGAVLALTRHIHAMNRRAQRAVEYALEAHTRERNRLARDLHDGLGQMLALLKLQMQRMGRMHEGEPVQTVFDESADHVAATLDELRRVARDLRPAPMQDRGFGEAVREYAAAIMQRTDLVVEVEGDYADPLSDDVGDELYRIAQECLTNCIKHSNARRVVVTMTEVGDRFGLLVADDGRGLSSDIPPGLGLATIRERSELLGGTCVISTPSGGGTQVEVSIPR